MTDTSATSASTSPSSATASASFRWRSGCSGSARFSRRRASQVTGEVIRPKFRELWPNREEWRAAALADRARHRARLLDRDHPGLGAYHLKLPLLRGGEEDLETPGGVRPRRGRGRGGAGVGEQRGLDRRVRADAGARHPDRAGDRGADRGTADPRRTAGADAGERSSQRVLGLRCLDVCRQPDAARAQPAAGRHLRAPAAHSVRLPLSADHHVLHDRRVRGRATRSSTSGSC